MATRQHGEPRKRVNAKPRGHCRTCGCLTIASVEVTTIGLGGLKKTRGWRCDNVRTCQARAMRTARRRERHEAHVTAMRARKEERRKHAA